MPENLGNFLIEGEDVKGFLPSFVGNENKGDFGRLVVIAGSRKYPGALNLTLLGAIRGGAGLIYSLNPYDIPIPYPEVIPIKEINFKPSALTIGPGFDDDESLFSLSYKILADFPDVPAVLDADGLKLLKLYPQLLERENLIITPHPGEFSRLFGGTPYEVDRKRIELTKEFSQKHKAILVLKGKPTVIGYRGKVYINPTGNLNLAKGGSGDILTGLIGAFLAWGIEPFKSSLMGVYIHGLAGELVQNRHFRITEMADKIPEAISKL
jgi:NAD(P)H-hydrate epimerase